MKTLIITLSLCTLFSCSKDRVITEHTKEGESFKRTISSMGYVPSVYQCHNNVLYISEYRQLSPAIKLDKTNHLKGIKCESPEGTKVNPNQTQCINKVLYISTYRHLAPLLKLDENNNLLGTKC